MTLTIEEEVLLGAPDVDRSRLGWLNGRVCCTADQFEQHLWPDRDAAFSTVSTALAKEGRVAFDGDRA